jgi:hypothetical protein
VLGPQPQGPVRHRLEDLHRAALVQQGQVTVLDDGADLGPVAGRERTDVDCGEAVRAGAQRQPLDGLDGDEGPGAAAVVHRVVDEPDVAAYGDAAAGGVEIGLGGDRVLVVADLVGGVGEEFDQGGAEVGGVALDPVGGGEAEPVEDDFAEGVVVAGGVVDDGCGSEGGRKAGALVRAVEGGGAVGLEAELGFVVPLVEPGEGLGAGPPVGVRVHDGEPVRGRVPGPVDGHVQLVVQLGVVLALDGDVEDGDAGDAAPAVDADVLRAQPARGLAEEGDGEGEAVVADLDGVDAVQARGADAVPPRFRPGRLGVHRAPLPSNTSSRRLAVERTTYRSWTRTTFSSLTTSRSSTSISSPSQRWSAAWTESSRAEASSGLLGVNTRSSSPQPKSGRITRSPGLVNSSCSIRSRM